MPSSRHDYEIHFYRCSTCNESSDRELSGHGCPACVHPDNIVSDVIHYSHGVPAKFLTIHCMGSLREKHAVGSFTRDPYEVTCEKCLDNAQHDIQQLEMDVFQYGRDPAFHDIEQSITIPSAYGAYVDRRRAEEDTLRRQIRKGIERDLAFIGNYDPPTAELLTFAKHVRVTVTAWQEAKKRKDAAQVEQVRITRLRLGLPPL